MIRRFFGDRGVFPVPALLPPVISALIHDRHDKTICDPWAGIGTILASVQEVTKAKSAIAIVQNRADFELGKVLLKLVVEYLGKQTRELLRDNRALCAEIFADASLELPSALSRLELGSIISATNKMRNDWGGHGGVVGQEEAQLRNEQLVGEVQKLREVMADTWVETQLIRALHTVHRRGVFENEVAVLMGSNSEFFKETRPMAISMDVERIYLSSGRATQALKLLPLVQIGPSPQSAKNACYFFSRLERDGGARFISYHYADKPELKGQFDDATEAIRFLTEA